MDEDDLMTVGGSEKSTGVAYSGTITVPGAITFIAVALEAGIQYQIDLEGRATGVGSLADPLLVGIFSDANTQLVGSDDNSGVDENSQLLFTPTTAGTYLIGVSSAAGGGAGTYVLFVNTEETATRSDSNFVAVEDSGDPFIDSITGDFVLSDTAFGSELDGIVEVSVALPVIVANHTDGGAAQSINEELEAIQFKLLADTFRTGLQTISSIANVVFSEVTDQDNALVNVNLVNPTSGISEELLEILGAAGDIRGGNGVVPGGIAPDVIGSDGFLNFSGLRELGMAVGLNDIDQRDFPTAFLGSEFTLFTSGLRSAFYDDVIAVDLYPSTFGYADILAFRQLYGENLNANGGDNTYVFDLSERYFETIFDLGGTDTIEIRGVGQDVSIDLRGSSSFLGGSFIDVGTTVRYFLADGAVEQRNETVFITPETIIENITASDGNDLLIGNAVANKISGGAGNDNINGDGGDDRLFGGPGGDVVHGGDGDDFLRGDAGKDLLSGGLGDDRIFAGADDLSDDIFVGGLGKDFIAGGKGNDFLIGGGQSGILALGSNEVGSLHAGNDSIFGGDGNDTIVVAFSDGNGNHLLDRGEAIKVSLDAIFAFGGAGEDKVIGAAGNDTLGGGEGDDVVEGAGGDDVIYGGKGIDLDGGLNDILSGDSGSDTVFGGTGSDRLNGNEGADLLFGGAGDDVLYSGAGDDEAFGGSGNDFIEGGAGDDTLRGNSGDDTIFGGSGADLFVFNRGDGNDVVLDFDILNDVLRIRSSNADFESVSDLISFAQSVIFDGQQSTFIAFGGGDSITLVGVTLTVFETIAVDF